LPSLGRPVFAAPRRVYRSERALHGHPVTRARSARHRLGPVDRPQLAQDVLNVAFDRVLADDEPRGDPGVARM
jgi:hypothetical protein